METTLSASALKLSRQFSGMTQKELADRIGLAQNAISMLERDLGAEKMDKATIERMGEVLGVAPEFLMDKINFREPSRPMQRAAKTGVLASQANKTLAMANLVQQHVGQILANHIDIEVSLPDLGASVVRTAREAALALRKFWGIGMEPVVNVTELCERYGVIIYRGRFPSESIVGFTMDSSVTGQPIVFVNENLPPDRDRLTLAHELGHLIRQHDLSVDDENNMENEAWDFAGEFLTPASELRRDVRALGRINLSSLAKLKRKWGASMASLAKQLADIGVLTRSQYQSIYVQLSRAGYRRREPVELPSEPESILYEIFRMLRADLGFSVDDIASELRITVSTFRQLYGKYWGGVQAKLRLVK